MEYIPARLLPIHNCQYDRHIKTYDQRITFKKMQLKEFSTFWICSLFYPFIIIKIIHRGLFFQVSLYNISITKNK